MRSRFYTLNIAASFMLLLSPMAPHVAWSQPQTSFLPVEISQGALPPDPLFTQKGISLQGELAYPWAISNNATYIFSHRYHPAIDSTSSKLVAKARSQDEILDAKYSSDKQLVAFRYGYASADSSGYILMVLNLGTKKLSVVDTELSYKSFSWSPDGRYLAYIKGGDKNGEVLEGGEVTQLCLYDTQTASTYVVVKNVSVANSFCWSAPHKLYYATLALAPGQTLATPQLPPDPKIIPPRPNLYFYSVEDKKSSLLFKDCYRPVISDDGKRVAFYGAETPEHPFPLTPDWQFKANYMAVCVADLDGTHRVALNVEQGDYPTLIWSPSGKSLTTLAQQGTKALQSMLWIKQWDTQTKHRLRTIELAVHDSFVDTTMMPDPSQASFNSYYTILGRYRDEDKIVVMEQQNARDTNRHLLGLRTLLLLVDMQTGETSRVVDYRDREKTIVFRWQQ